MIIILLSSVIGALLSRWHGGGFGKPPKLLAAAVWSLPFAGVAQYATSQIWVACAVFALTMLFRQTGHGGAMDAGRSAKEPNAGRKPEKLEHLILWLNGRTPPRAYDGLLNAIIGCFAVLAASVAVCEASPYAGAVLMAAGMGGRPLAYDIGHSLEDAGFLSKFPHWADHGSAVGELLYGAFVYAALAAAWVML